MPTLWFSLPMYNASQPQLQVCVTCCVCGIQKLCSLPSRHVCNVVGVGVCTCVCVWQLYDYPLHPRDYTCTDSGCSGGFGCRVMLQSMAGDPTMFILGDTVRRRTRSCDVGLI